MRSRRRYEPPSGYRFSSSAVRASASSAAGKGPSDPSLEASLTTRSSPSSRWTSSTGFPGSYGTSSSSAARTRLRELVAGASAALQLADEPAGDRQAGDRPDDGG